MCAIPSACAISYSTGVIIFFWCHAAGRGIALWVTVAGPQWYRDAPLCSHKNTSAGFYKQPWARSFPSSSSTESLFVRFASWLGQITEQRDIKRASDIQWQTIHEIHQCRDTHKGHILKISIYYVGMKIISSTVHNSQFSFAGSRKNVNCVFLQITQPSVSAVDNFTTWWPQSQPFPRINHATLIVLTTWSSQFSFESLLTVELKYFFKRILVGRGLSFKFFVDH